MFNSQALCALGSKVAGHDYGPGFGSYFMVIVFSCKRGAVK